MLAVPAPDPQDFATFKEYELHVLAWATCLRNGVDEAANGTSLSTQAVVGSAHQCSPNFSWSHLQVPQEPSPFQYSTLEQYEAAVLQWRDGVLQSHESLPPAPYSLRGLRCFEPASRHVQSDTTAAYARAGASQAPYGYCGAVGGGLALVTGMPLKRGLQNALHGEAKKALPRLKKGFKDREGNVVGKPTVTKARVEVDWNGEVPICHSHSPHICPSTALHCTVTPSDPDSRLIDGGSGDGVGDPRGPPELRVVRRGVARFKETSKRRPRLPEAHRSRGAEHVFNTWGGTSLSRCRTRI